MLRVEFLIILFANHHSSFDNESLKVNIVLHTTSQPNNYPAMYVSPHLNITHYTPHHQTYYFIVVAVAFVVVFACERIGTKNIVLLYPIISKNMGCLACNLSDSSLLEMIAVCLFCLLLLESHTHSMADDANVDDDDDDNDGQFHCHLIRLWMITLGIFCCSYIKCIHRSSSGSMIVG